MTNKPIKRHISPSGKSIAFKLELATYHRIVAIAEKEFRPIANMSTVLILEALAARDAREQVIGGAN